MSPYNIGGEIIMSPTLSVKNNNVVNRYQTECKVRFKSSTATRIAAVNQFIKYINKKKVDISSVNYEVVQDFLSIEMDEGKSKYTISSHYYYLKDFFKFLIRSKDNNVMEYEKVDIERTRNLRFRTFSVEQIHEVFNIILKEKNRIVRFSNTILFRILLLTGCTRKEVASIVVYQSKNDISEGEIENSY